MLLDVVENLIKLFSHEYFMLFFIDRLMGHTFTFLCSMMKLLIFTATENVASGK